MRFVEKLKLVRYMYRNSFSFLSLRKKFIQIHYIARTFCCNIQQKADILMLEFCNNDSAIFFHNHHAILQRFSEIILQCFRNLSMLYGLFVK